MSSIIRCATALFPRNFLSQAKIRLRRSTNGGATFLPVQDLSSEGGWWPQAGIDPRDPTGATFHAFWDAPTYRHSTDGGATFSKPLWSYPVFSYNRLHRSQLVVDANGNLHTTTSGYFYSSALGGICDWDTFYRRVSPQPAPSGSKIGIRLITQGGSFEERADNVQAVSKTLDFKNAMSAEVWVKDMVGGIGTGYSDYKTPVFFKQRDLSTGYSPAYGLGTVAGYGKRKIVADIMTTTGLVSLLAEADAGVLNPGVWTHLAMTYDSQAGADNFKLYQNGALIATSTVTGAIVPGYGNLFVGRYGNWVVDDLRLWNRALKPNEIAFNMHTALTGTETGLSAYYNFDNTARDITGRGNDGVLMYRETYVAGVVGVQKPQTITFPVLGAKKMGDGIFNPNASASSGLTVALTSGNPQVAKVLTDGRLRIVGAGSAIITARQPGNANWLAANPVSRKLVVEKGPQTIRFSTLLTRPYERGKTFTLKATATSTLKVRFASSNSAVIAINGNIATIRGKGLATITATQAGSTNWLAAKPVARTVRIQ